MRDLLTRKPTQREIDTVVGAAHDVVPNLSIARYVSLYAFVEWFTPLSNLVDIAPFAYRHNIEQALRMGSMYATGNNHPAYEAAKAALAKLMEVGK